jgi:hypothetical protein
MAGIGCYARQQMGQLDDLILIEGVEHQGAHMLGSPCALKDAQRVAVGSPSKPSRPQFGRSCACLI